jgi:hypothetical protein
VGHRGVRRFVRLVRRTGLAKTTEHEGRYTIAVVNPPKRNRPMKLLLRGAAILFGLWGGWLLAGALNDHRDDVPRPVPTTHPANPSAQKN